MNSSIRGCRWRDMLVFRSIIAYVPGVVETKTVTTYDRG